MQQPLSTGRHRRRAADDSLAQGARALCEWYWARHRASKRPAPAAQLALPAAVTA